LQDVFSIKKIRGTTADKGIRSTFGRILPLKKLLFMIMILMVKRPCKQQLISK
jgi:hypothetical protein